jgi:cytochrome c oxidase subunit 4
VKKEYKLCVSIWLSLVVLALLSLGSAYLPMGMWNAVASMGIAAIKVALVVAFFMRLGGTGAVRIYAAAGLFVLMLLLIISGADYATRVTDEAPWQTPLGEKAS